MNIVDSSGWLAYFADEPNAKHFLTPLSDSESLVVPVITIYEVFKVILRESSENEALQAVVAMQKGKFNRQSEIANANNIQTPETVTAGTKQATSIPKAKGGGVFAGPKTGFPVQLHGNEMVAPYNPNSILAKLLTQEPATSATPKIIKEERAPEEKKPDFSFIKDELMALLSDKFDSLIDAVESSNDTQERILQAARS